MGPSRWRSSGATAWARRTLCQAIMGLIAADRRGLRPLRRQGAHGAGLRTRSPAPASATSRRVVDSSRRSRVDEHLGCSRQLERRPLDDARRSTSSSRGSPSARRSAAPSSRAASSRCSPSAARCSRNPTLLIMDEPSEGLAPTIVEGIVETLEHARRGGSRAPPRRAEPRRRDRARRAAARHGRRPDLHRDDRRRAPGRPGAAAALPRRDPGRAGVGSPGTASSSSDGDRRPRRDARHEGRRVRLPARPAPRARRRRAPRRRRDPRRAAGRARRPARRGRRGGRCGRRVARRGRRPRRRRRDDGARRRGDRRAPPRRRTARRDRSALGGSGGTAIATEAMRRCRSASRS